VEVGERKDRVTDALNATKAAVDEGIVAGGGAALLHASRSLAKVKESMDNLDQRVGVDIIARAVQMPAKTILKNAGHEGAVVVGKLLESDDPNFGFDASKDQYCNMVEAGARRPERTPTHLLIHSALEQRVLQILRLTPALLISNSL
jgi:chaperonin GroEL